MKFLFLKRTLSWPRATGHDVHTFHMAKALADLGHAIEFATVIEPSPNAVAGLAIDGVRRLASGGRQPPVASQVDKILRQQGADAPRSPKLSWLQRRYLRYWGIDRGWIDATQTLVASLHPDVVVAAGLDVLPCLAAVRGAVRVWYAADEYAFHQLSMLKLAKTRTWRHIFDAAVAGLYERAYSSHIDRVWVVSPEERRAMRRVSGIRAVDVAPNGVDGDYFRPGSEPLVPRSCAFWGRLDAGPNIQAVAWLANQVWPGVRRAVPDARFTAYGFNPVESVRALAGKNGIQVVADSPDLRPALRQHPVAVMPFVSGGGIKNKLLEAAALGMAIVATPMACGGLHAGGPLPLVVARTSADWITALQNLWADADECKRRGTDARRWVLEHHSWEAAARAVLSGLGEHSDVNPAKPEDACVSP